MAGERIYSIDLNTEVDRLFDDSSVVGSGNPKAVVLMGGVAAGKTYLRTRNYSRGYVLIDAAEIFHHLSRGDGTLDFPDALKEPLELIGPLVTKRALSERRNIVTEIIGAELGHTKELIDSLNALQYKVEVVEVTCDLQESLRRNANRGDNISAYYAESFQRHWIINACKDPVINKTCDHAHDDAAP